MRCERLVWVLFFCFVLAGPAGAFLPPDASEREPEIRAHTMKVRKNYEKKLVERRAYAVKAYEKTEAAIYIPPWDRAYVLEGKPRESADVVSERKIASKKETKNRVLVSIVLLIIIGSAVGWVKYATREVEL